MEIFDVEANNFEFYFKKIGSIVLTLTDVWVLINLMEKLIQNFKILNLMPMGWPMGVPGPGAPWQVSKEPKI